MSISTSVKIKQLREHLDLSRPAFAQQSNLSVETLRSLEKKGGEPSKQTKERIKESWPYFAQWIESGSTSLIESGLLATDNNVFRILDVLTISEIQRTYIKADKAKELILLVTEGSLTAALVVLVDEALQSIASAPRYRGGILLRIHESGFLENSELQKSLEGIHNWNPSLLDNVSCKTVAQDALDSATVSLSLPNNLLEELDDKSLKIEFLQWKVLVENTY